LEQPSPTPEAVACSPRTMLNPCRVCPRLCGVNRLAGEQGYCRTGARPRVASAGAHFGEEAVLVGPGGSGTIFFSGCNLHCVFCQNFDISRGRGGVEVSTEQLAGLMLDLARRGCSNINLVTPTHVAPQIIEAVALAHDLGHPPFGHAGEEALDELMADHGHFEHNRQSLRVVDYLEHPYPDFRGLNLTLAVRRCLAKHQTRYDRPTGGEFDDDLRAPLEGQLVDLADEIAYTAADLYDALAAGWADTRDLEGLALWRQARDQALTRSPQARPIHVRIQACRNALGIMAADAVAATGERIGRMDPTCLEDIQSAPDRTAAFSDELSPAVGQMQDFLLRQVYRHPDALDQQRRGQRIIGDLFSAYLKDPGLLPDRYRQRIDEEAAHRVICDYIAGMTDRFCRAEHDKIAGGQL